MQSPSIKGQGGGGGGSDLTYNPNRPLANQKRNAQNYQKYMDKMSEALNKNMEKNIFPHWRNHASLKGKDAIAKCNSV